MSISLAFSGGKLCCNKKTGKNTVSCKFNHAAIEADKDVAGELKEETADWDQKALQSNKANVGKCATSCAKAPWWKFWAKKSQKNCPCKQANTAKTADNG